MHILNAAVDHPDWCEWTGLIPGIVMPITGTVNYRCPGCWAIPTRTQASPAQTSADLISSE